MILSTILAAVLLSGSAQAEIKSPGTILTTECAQKISTVGPVRFSEALPKTLCFAEVVGRNETYLMLDSTLWEVQEKSGDLMLRKAGVNENGTFAPRQYSIGRSGHNLYFDGTRDGDIVKLYMDGQTIRAESFVGMYHTM